MGIDAEMLVKVKSPKTEKEIRRLSFELCEAFGHESFWLSPEREAHALEIVAKYEQDGPTIRPKPGEQFVRVNLATRYYGPGYERGDANLLLGVADWLERRLGEVWYGGDSSGVVAKRFDANAREAMRVHFVEHGHRPYQGEFSPINMAMRENEAAEEPHRDCSFCREPMVRYGWGPSYAALMCLGCGDDVVTTDEGKTFVTRKEHDASGG